MNEIWDPLSEGMDRPFVQAIGECRTCGYSGHSRYLNMDMTAEDHGDEGRTVRITVHRTCDDREYIMTEAEFVRTLGELNRLRAMMDTWGGIGSGVLG